MMKRFYTYLTVMAIVLIAASCSSTKHAGKLPHVGNLTGMEYMEKVISSTPEWNSLSAKASFDLGLGNKGNTHVNGNLRIRRGEVVQFSIAPVLGIEVARLEITPEGLLLVDRINKRFVRASFKSVSELLRVDVNFHILQSLFLNELFLPGKSSVGPADLSAFALSLEGEQVTIQPRGLKNVNYQFQTAASLGLLLRTLMTLRGTQYGLNWDYSDFSELHGKPFPKKTQITLLGTGTPYYLHLKLSRMSVNGKWDSRTELSSRYKEIELQELLKVLLKL